MSHVHDWDRGYGNLLKMSGVGSILDKVEKDTEDTANLYLYIYLRYIFGQPVSYQYLKILDEAKDKISFCKLSSIPIVSIPV